MEPTLRYAFVCWGERPGNVWGGRKRRALEGAEAELGELSQELISPYSHLECVDHHPLSDRFLLRAPAP